MSSAKEIRAAISNLFERNTLLNKLVNLKRFSTTSFQVNESILKFSNRNCKWSSSIESMKGDLLQEEVAMVLSKGMAVKVRVR